MDLAKYATSLSIRGSQEKYFCVKKIFVNPSVSKLLKWFLPSIIMGLKSGNPNKEQDGSRKAKNSRKDAHIAEINYDILVAHCAMMNNVT